MYLDDEDLPPPKLTQQSDDLRLELCIYTLLNIAAAGLLLYFYNSLL
jgi:hypothetical protein